jgi:hypothetical protein
MNITRHMIDQAYSDHHSVYGGVPEDYFGLVYLEREHKLPRDVAANQVAFCGNDYGLDAFHFDETKRNLYLFQFKFSDSHSQFKGSLQRLIEEGMDRIFHSPTKDDLKNQVLLQLRSCLVENKSVIDQICFRFIFTGDPEEAEHSKLLDKLREDLENKKYLVDQFFGDRKVGFVVEFRSSTGKVGIVRQPHQTTSFEIPLTDRVSIDGPTGEKMHIGFIRLADLGRMHRELGSYFFHSNIRYGLGESEAVNRAISNTLKQIVLDQVEYPGTFAFNHNGITLCAESVELLDGHCRLKAPRLLNGAQTVTTFGNFLEKNKDNPKLAKAAPVYESIRVLCKIITAADQDFTTRVTINNNRQNPVEPWNLHANDIIQLELQDKLSSDVGIYYERQENAFDQLTTEDLAEYGIKEESKALQMLKLTQTFLLTDGNLSRISEIRRVFEDEKVYNQVFRPTRLKADSRRIVLCYKVQLRLSKLAREIEQKGQNKYAFIHRSRYLLWALMCQGLLNHSDIEALAQKFGRSMTLPVDFSELLSQLATTRVRLLLGALMDAPEYKQKVADGNLSFLRTDIAFEKCMEVAYKKWHWLHKKLA